MSKFGPWTPGTIPDDYEARVKADTRNILERTILRAMSTGFSSQNPNSTQPNTQGKENSSTYPSAQGKENNPPASQASISEAEFQKFFADDDVDDSEEIFQQILQSAEEAAKRDIEMNKKHPLLTLLNLNMSSEKKTRKRKNKGIEKSLEIINRFKKSLIEPLDVDNAPQEKTVSTLNTMNSSNAIKPIIKNSSYPEDATAVKVYPKWKTTATYTPIFPSATNPNWADINSLAETDKMYTPGHITSWLNSALRDGHFTEQHSSKSFRSNTATVTTSSILKNNEKSIVNTETPIETDQAVSSIPKRSTIVRFKSLSPEKIPWDSDGVSSISSRSLKEEEMNSEQFQDSNDETDDYYASLKQIKNNNYYFTPIQNQTLEKNQKCIDKYTFSDEQHISNYETSSLKNIETSPILTNPLNSKTPMQNMNVCFKPSPLKNIPWNNDDRSSISSISLMGDHLHLKQIVDSDDENNQYYSKKCQQYPQKQQLFKIHQEYTEKLNFTDKKNIDVSPPENLPWNCDNQALISPTSFIGDKIHYNQFGDSDDKNHQYFSKPCQQQNKMFTVHQEYKEKFNFTGKLNPNRLNQNVADAPFVMQKFVNTLAKKLDRNNYDMEVKCSMKLKKKLF
ncbi:uncharacterized protein LOC100678595 [Nasonia vitripennis]|uniref:Uncharacterized protein n=1 Tax=Nasonia vitripennis TaxID=7425 RepID=A0A7M7T7N2_NASVI|nr:uncharacterized protein LOC100678595 [Nasonia vitripennis]